MRSENEVKENLEWLTGQCANFKDDEAIAVIRQLETLLWVLGQERDQATARAESLWHNSRQHRARHPRDHS